MLTWPDGNGYIIRRMQATVGPALCSGLARRVQPGADCMAVDVYEPGRNASRRIVARTAVLATPRFVANRLFDRAPDPAQSYAPWMVANVTVGKMPGGRSAPLCWDNVIYGSRSLGYVVATHQALQQVQRRTVLTYYWPLSGQSPGDARRAALARNLAEWQAMVLAELLAVHPELDGAVERIDVWLWGPRHDPAHTGRDLGASAGCRLPSCAAGVLRPFRHDWHLHLRGGERTRRAGGRCGSGLSAEIVRNGGACGPAKPETGGPGAAEADSM